jgi:nucleotide-binding universal stress UspA family protein
MCANILLSTDGSDVARKGVKHGIALAKALNAKVTIITVTEPLSVDYGSGHAGGWIPSREEFDRFEAARKEHAGKVLDEAGAMAEQNSCVFRIRTRPVQLSKQQNPEAAT